MHEIVPGNGPLHCKIAFVGEKPGEEEAAQGKGFVGKSGTLLWLWSWHYARLNRGEVYVTNLDKEYAEGNPDPTPEAIAEWGPYLVEELREVGCRWVVTLGRYASSYLTGLPYTMETMHGRPWPDCRGLGVVVVPIFHPAGGLHRDSLLAYTAEGLRMLAALLEGVVLPTEGQVDYRRVARVEELRRVKFPPVLPVDTEGMPADPWCVQYSLRPGHARMIAVRDKRLVAEFKRQLELQRPTLAFHNAPWDFKVLRAMGIDVLAMGLRFIDTIIYPRQLKVEPYSLKNLARRHLGMKMAEYQKVVKPVEEEFAWRYLLPAAMKAWPKEGRSHTPGRRVLSALDRFEKTDGADSLVDWWVSKDVREVRRRVEERLGATMPKPGFDDMPAARFLRYACRDADAQGQIVPVLQREAKRLGVEAVVEVEHAALPLVERMEQVGMRVDVEALSWLEGQLSATMADEQAVCAELAGSSSFNPGSTDDVAEWCRQEFLRSGRCGLEKTTSKGATSTDDDQLKAIRNDHPMIESVLAWRAAETLKSSYTTPLPTLLDADGVYRPKFGYVRESEEKTAGARTETGRLKERILTIPTRSEEGRLIRTAFKPIYPDWVFVSADYSQIELRFAAEFSGDDALLKVFQDGRDPHDETAINILGASKSQSGFEQKRYVAKTGNFALIYLASAKTLWEKFRAEGVTGFDEQAVEEFRQDWFRLYPGIPRYYKRQVAFAKQHGYVRTRLGRVRFLPGIYCDDASLREDNGWLPWYPYGFLFDRAMKIAGNHPIQGGVTDLILQAMANLWRVWGQTRPAVLGWGPIWEPAVQIHDDMMVQCHEADAKDVGAMMKRVMLAQQSEYRVPIDVKVKVGRSWGELESQKEKETAA